MVSTVRPSVIHVGTCPAFTHSCRRCLSFILSIPRNIVLSWCVSHFLFNFLQPLGISIVLHCFRSVTCTKIQLIPFIFLMSLVKLAMIISKHVVLVISTDLYSSCSNYLFHSIYDTDGHSVHNSYPYYPLFFTMLCSAGSHLCHPTQVRLHFFMLFFILLFQYGSFLYDFVLPFLFLIVSITALTSNGV